MNPWNGKWESWDGISQGIPGCHISAYLTTESHLTDRLPCQKSSVCSPVFLSCQLSSLPPCPRLLLTRLLNAPAPREWTPGDQPPRANPPVQRSLLLYISFVQWYLPSTFGERWGPLVRVQGIACEIHYYVIHMLYIYLCTI